MEIRSITLFAEPAQELEPISRLFEDGKMQFAVPVQTCRVAFPPFPNWWPEQESPAATAADLVSRWQQAGADYLCLGPAQLNHDGRWVELLSEIVGTGNALFASAEIADTDNHIDSARCFSVARLVQATSKIQEDGFGNLYFTALANCPSGSPFFPVAYKEPGAPSCFALALEAADLALTAFQSAATLKEARQNLVTAIETQARRLERDAQSLAREHGIAFGGIDFSLAPYPQQARSLAAAIEALGAGHIGAPGTLFAAAFITDAIDRAQFQRCGFSGLMLPVLEDSVLAKRAGAGEVTVNDLLSMSAVCGVGLDTIPLPGDVSEAALAGILLDVAALAVRLQKPLTARLMPLPGRRAGDDVTFDFPYFADSRVMSLPATGAIRLLAHGETVTLNALAQRQSS